MESGTEYVRRTAISAQFDSSHENSGDVKGRWQREEGV